MNRAAALGGLALLAAGTIAASLFVGPAGLGPGEVLRGLSPSDPNHDIVVGLRLARAILGLVAGAALAGSGAIFQGLFRNPLADPFVVGVSGGAALGAVLAIVTGLELQVFGLGAVTLAAFAGAIAATWIVWRLAGASGRVSVATLVLAGFAVSAFASALVSILLLVNQRSWGEVLFWLFGSLDRMDGWVRVRVALPVTAVALAAAWAHARKLNLLLLGEEPAAQLGVDVERARWVLLTAGTIAAAAAVATCGIIGFVGLVVPHAVRLVAGPDHRTLLPSAALAGGAFLVIADVLARLALPPGGLPVGAVTALAGAPFFVLLLRRRKSV